MVVLPFANIGGDPEQEHFVDGVTESLTTDLSRIRGAVVIARNTAFTYKGKPLDAEDDRARVECPLCPRGQRSARRQPHARQCAAASTPKPAIISGPSGSTSRSPISSTCRTKSSRAWRTRSNCASSIAAEARRAEQAPRTPDSMDLYLSGRGLVQQGLRSPETMLGRKRAAFSIARSPPIPTTSTRSSDRARGRWSTAQMLL